LFARIAAHFLAGLQTGAECGSFRLAENHAAVAVIKLNAAHPGRFAIGHAGNRAVDRGGGAARTA